MLALQRGDPTRSLALIGRAIAIRPDQADSHAGMAEAYWALGRLDEAAKSGQEALRLNPGSWQARCNLGSTLVALGRLEAAVTLFREAIQIKPDCSQAHNNLGQALHIQGNSSGALESYQLAVKFNPNSAEARGNLGLILLDRGDYPQALHHCLEAARLQPNSSDVHLKLGNVYQVLDRLAEAEASFRRSIQLRPSHAAAHAALGGLLEHLGETEQSVASFREALRLDPRHAGVLARLATRMKDRLPATDQATIESLLADPALVADHRQPLLYGLAHVFDARGEFDRAAALTIEANDRQNREFEERGLKYNRQARANDVEQIIGAFTADYFEKVHGWGLSTDRPVFIVGMPRSGTSLVEQILASHSQVHGAGELRLAATTFKACTDAAGPAGSLRECLDRLDRDSVRRLARSHLEGLEAIDRTSARIIDKMPENTLFLGLIALIFPKARVIHCQRDPRDTALSCWMTHFGLLRWSCDAEAIAARIVESDRIMEHWRRVLPLPIFEVRYEELVEDLESRSRELVSACGLDWEPACLDFHSTRRQVRTASVLQVRQPIYRGSVGRWRNYEKSLAFLFDKIPIQG